VAQPEILKGGGLGGGMGAEPGNFLQFFNRINAFLCIFRPKKLFEAITYQLKAFEKQSKRTGFITQD